MFFSFPTFFFVLSTLTGKTSGRESLNEIQTAEKGKRWQIQSVSAKSYKQDYNGGWVSRLSPSRASSRCSSPSKKLEFRTLIFFFFSRSCAGNITVVGSESETGEPCSNFGLVRCDHFCTTAIHPRNAVNIVTKMRTI